MSNDASNAASKSGRARDPSMNALLRIIMTAGAAVLVILLGSMALTLLDAALPAFGSMDGFSSRSVLATVLSASLAIGLAVPLSLGAAFFITEFAPLALSRWAAAVLDVMGALPTLVFGMWGMLMLLPLLGPDASHVSPSLWEGIVLAGLVLSVMLLPYLSGMAHSLIIRVPNSLREAAIAVGATRWEVIRHVVLPHVRLGFLGATALGLGRALGESMAVILLLGSVPGQSPATTLATTLLSEFQPGIPPAQSSSLALLAGCLFVVTFAIRGVGRVLVRRSNAAGGLI